MVSALTGIDEKSRGFVAPFPPPFYGKTKNNRMVARFTLACGVTDEPKGKFAIWRKCVCYDKTAEKLENIKPGLLLKVTGYLVASPMRDEYYRVMRDRDGNPITIKILFGQKVEIMAYEKDKSEKQLSFA